MQKNETVLTPVYRYILEVLESYGKTDNDKLIVDIEKFKKHLQTGVFSINSEGNDYLIIDSLIELLNRIACSEYDGEIYWNNKLEKLKTEECTMCAVCRSCKVYFWKELGELFFNKTNDEKKNKKYLPVRQLPKEILRHLEPSVGMSELYYSREKRRKNSTLINKFIMLKGMSSSTPAMLNNIFDTEEFVGGGFYFNWQGYGVVIDPGYSFIKNLHHYGLSVLDINAVVITHEHIDHNNDMRLLEDLHFSVMRYEEQLGEETHTLNWYLDKVSYDIALTLQKNEAGFRSEANKLYCVNADCSYELSEKKLFIETFETQHIWDKNNKKYNDNTIGCRFICINEGQKRTMVYTSDTRYYPELSDIIQDADMVIANISGIYEDDYMLVKEKTTHLGYYGCYNLIKNCYAKYHNYPTFYFLSEFWNGKSDIRYDVAKCLKRELHAQGIEEMNIIPTEVGMVFDIENCTLQCSQCGNFSDKILIKKPATLGAKVEVICSECHF